MSIKIKANNKYYFTFGCNHVAPNGSSLGDCYTVINAPSREAAIQVMTAARGKYWSMVYPSALEAGVNEWDLREVSLDEISL